MDSPQTVVSIGNVSIKLESQSVLKSASQSSEIWAKLWNSSKVLCEYLSNHVPSLNPTRILELGCGLGLTGLFSAHQFPHAESIFMTDMSEPALNLLTHNIQLNTNVNQHSALIHPVKFNWFDYERADEVFGPDASFDLILGADILYWEKAVKVLPLVIDRLLGHQVGCRAILVDPDRCYVETFVDAVSELNLVVNVERIRHQEMNFNIITISRNNK